MMRCRFLVGFILFTMGLCLGALLDFTRVGIVMADSPAQAVKADAPPNDGKLRIIAFGAHPDDCEIKAGGAAAKWAALGHHVKFVSTTNGDIGHWKLAGGPLALRRKAEVENADRLLGITSQVLDIHDGELEPTLDNRRTITRLIRQWHADIVLAHRPNDYHPDHRYTGVLVQDAAYMVTVPFFCPDVPYLHKNPAFFYYSDHFERPAPFRADFVVDIDDVNERKLDALDCLVSQFFEGVRQRLGGPHPERCRGEREASTRGAPRVLQHVDGNGPALSQQIDRAIRQGARRQGAARGGVRAV